jgi:Domain of unknown function (DUF397)
MSTIRPTGVQWRKSSHSNGQANCVEVATVRHERPRVAVRDSKVINGSCLIFTTRAWRQLIKDFEAGVR